MQEEGTEFLSVAVEAARRGGEVLASWSKRFTVKEKSKSNLVTEADHESQRVIFEIVRGRFPEHGFLGEEEQEIVETDSPYCWIVDPLDGTSNYVHGFPYYAVSIGLTHEGEPIAGVIFDPNRDEMFTATKGGGSFLNGERIASSTTAEMEHTMAVASLPIAAKPDDIAIARFLYVLQKVQTVQRTGSAALNLAYVASGRIDVFWSSSLKPWDMAAGALIVAEAGGKVSNAAGERLDLFVPDILSTNGTKIHEKMSELLVSKA